MVTTRYLKVSSPEGQLVRIRVNLSGGLVTITSDQLDILKNENITFVKNGRLFFQVAQKKYAQTLKELTKYLEDLYLKRMSDDSTSASNRNADVGKRDKKSRKTRKAGTNKREGADSPVCPDTRGDDKTESDRGGETDDPVAPGGDPEDSVED